MTGRDTPAGHFQVEIADNPRGFHGGAPCKSGRTTRVGLATQTPPGHHLWVPHGFMGGVRVDAARCGVKITGCTPGQKLRHHGESNPEEQTQLSIGCHIGLLQHLSLRAGFQVRARRLGSQSILYSI
ncbi:hypothetical protein PSTG_12133 [Puccinia striiformis f. sp. tritici PST-78]|uniref:Uncharacterized protein n=1 Tax=Puccinia striiformis f. sp. tritici PST-78 TaxID=1165861 RepID=A0A0L0V5N6_9BASI|nr:hypothetical protein PSTG_12133 [Puccinia striiformis f. sp. tritici PST-78]